MDQLGRYSRVEMREMVRRRVDAIRHTNITVEGAESGLSEDKIIDPLITNEDLNMHLATALTVRYIDIIGAEETTFADEATIDVETNTVEYALPEDLTVLRALYWKDTATTGTIVPPSERVLMVEDDGDSDIGNMLGNWVPTYRRRLNMIVLNQVPSEDNGLGILVDYVKAPLPFLDDGQVLEYQFATILQEVMILDVVIEIVQQKMQLDITQLQARADMLTDKLIIAARMTKFPKSSRLVNPISFVTQPRNFVRRGGRIWR